MPRDSFREYATYTKESRQPARPLISRPTATSPYHHWKIIIIMRIITGKYKGRKFDVPHTFKARPTTDMAKENIFNVMQSYIDWDGAMALDLFAGTGSISLEMLSRGCASVTGVEMDRDHARWIKACMDYLKVDNYLLIRGDVFRFLKSCRQQFDVIFADPPYALEQLPQIPDLIFQYDLLKPEGLFVFEHGKKNDFSNHPYFIDHRNYGSVNFSLFKKKEPATDTPEENPSEEQ